MTKIRIKTQTAAGLAVICSFIAAGLTVGRGFAAYFGPKPAQSLYLTGAIIFAIAAVALLLYGVSAYREKYRSDKQGAGMAFLSLGFAMVITAGLLLFSGTSLWPPAPPATDAYMLQQWKKHSSGIKTINDQLLGNSDDANYEYISFSAEDYPEFAYALTVSSDVEEPFHLSSLAAEKRLLRQMKKTAVTVARIDRHGPTDGAWYMTSHGSLGRGTFIVSRGYYFYDGKKWANSPDGPAIGAEMQTQRIAGLPGGPSTYSFLPLSGGWYIYTEKTRDQ